MKIAIDISPIDPQNNSQHKVRGVGMYVSLLKENLEKFDTKNQYLFSSNPEKETVDLVHYPYLDPFFVTFPFNQKLPTVITVHDLIPITHREHFPAGIKGNISWQINKRIIKRANHVITDSIASKKSLEKLTGISSSKVTPVYLGIGSSFRQAKISDQEKKELFERFSLPQKFFLYVGDVTWNKNLPRLISAIKKTNIPLVMVGKALTSEYDKTNPWNKDRLVIERETQSPLFLKLGFVEEKDLVALYNLSLALVMPSIDEGFGLPVLEGMTCGAPVIVSRGGSLPEVAGEAGIYVDEYDEENIFEKLSEVGSSEKLRNELSEKSLKQAKQFSIEKMIKDTVKVYESVI